MDAVSITPTSAYGNGIGPDLFDPVENLDGRDPVEIENEGHPEFREGPDENDGASGENAGPHQRKRDFEKTLPAPATEILGRFLHRRIDIRQRSDGVEVEDGIKAQSVQGDHPPEPALSEPIDRLPGIEPADLHEEGVQHAVLAEDLADADRPDERRQHDGQKDQGRKNLFPEEFIPVGDKGERQRDEEGENRREEPHSKGIPQALHVEIVPEDFEDVGDGPLTVQREKTALQHLPDRPQEKTAEKHRGHRVNSNAETPAHSFSIVDDLPVAKQKVLLPCERVTNLSHSDFSRGPRDLRGRRPRLQRKLTHARFCACFVP